MPSSTEYGIYRADKIYNIEYELFDDKKNFILYKIKRTVNNELIEKSCLGQFKTIDEVFNIVSQDYVNYLIVHVIEKYKTEYWQYNARGQQISL